MLTCLLAVFPLLASAKLWAIPNVSVSFQHLLILLNVYSIGSGALAFLVARGVELRLRDAARNSIKEAEFGMQDKEMALDNAVESSSNK
jgi:hypothetical protein